MRNTTIIRGGAGRHRPKTILFSGATLMLALLVSTEGTQAWYMDYRGMTPDELRATCTGEVAEGPNFVSCFVENKPWVTCWYGWCRRGGERDISGGRGFRTRDYQPPQSLVDTGGDSGGAVAPSLPAPSAPTPPIFN